MVSRVPRGTKNDSGLRGSEHITQGSGSMGERGGCAKTESIHRKAVRIEYVGLGPPDSSSRFGSVPQKLQHILQSGPGFLEAARHREALS